MPARVVFDERVAVVTGAGSGLGRSYAVELARRGARVVVNDVDGSAAEAVVRDIEAAGGAAVAAVASVATRHGGTSVIDAAIDHFVESTSW